MSVPTTLWNSIGCRSNSLLFSVHSNRSLCVIRQTRPSKALKVGLTSLGNLDLSKPLLVLEIMYSTINGSGDSN